MSRDGSADVFFGDGEHKFRLAIGDLEELQEKTGCGPLALLERLEGGQWRTGDVSNVLRIGLVGGGMAAQPAHALVERYVRGVPDWVYNARLAYVVLAAAITGSPEEPVGKTSGAGESEATPAPTDASNLPDFTATAP